MWYVTTIDAIDARGQSIVSTDAVPRLAGVDIKDTIFEFPSEISSYTANCNIAVKDFILKGRPYNADYINIFIFYSFFIIIIIKYKIVLFRIR